MRLCLSAFGPDPRSLIRAEGRADEQLQFELTYLKFNLVAPHVPQFYLGLGKFT